MGERFKTSDLFGIVEDPTIPEGEIEIRTDVARLRITGVAPPATELPQPGPSNIVVRTPSPLKAPGRVEEQ